MTITDENEPLAPLGQPAERIEFRARIGSPLQILTARFGRTASFASSVIGYVRNEYLIVKTPIEGGFSVPLQNGEYLRIRLFTGTNVLDFESVLLRQFGAPLYHWHLQYPGAVQAVVLRSAPRTRVNLAGHARIEGAPASIEVQVVDLSAEGAQIVASQSLGEKDAVVALAIVIGQRDNGSPIEVSVSARIKVVKPLARAPGAEPRPAYGVQFEGLEELARLRLENFVLKRLNDESNGMA